MREEPSLQFAFPKDAYVRLKVLSALTGTPEGTMRDACRFGEMGSRFQVGSYYARLSDHEAWVCGDLPHHARPDETGPSVGVGRNANGRCPKFLPELEKPKRTRPGKRRLVHMNE